LSFDPETEFAENACVAKARTYRDHKPRLAGTWRHRQKDVLLASPSRSLSRLNCLLLIGTQARGIGLPFVGRTGF
jgi:hypothetical protein